MNIPSFDTSPISPTSPATATSPDSPAASPIPARIAALRAAMARAGIDAYLVPSADPHLSEYLPARWQARQWLCGFTGSAGTLVVTPAFAGLWTDSRYWEQAERQLAGTGVALMKMAGGQQTQPYINWLAQNVPAGSTVAADGAVLGVALARALTDALAAPHNDTTPTTPTTPATPATLRTDCDLLDEIWPARPALPREPVYEHAAPHAGASRADKLDQVRRALREHGAQWHFISTLDDLAWLLNLRGSDVGYNPVFVAHALIGLEHVTLFVAEGKVSAALTAALARDGVRVAPYAHAAAALAALPAGEALLADPKRVTFGLLAAVPSTVKVLEAINPSVFFKSRKNPAQAHNVRATMEQDGAALAEFFAWFETALQASRAAGNASGTLTELSVDERLSEARARRAGFVSPSFATIAGFNANGAMPHYCATPHAHSPLVGDGLLLIDSGGQYLDGTTDITRVVPVGEPSAAQRRDFTLVLKAMMALARAQFPRGIRSPMLDALARAPLWEAGLDYGHGTGHGVGYFLNVHEGPQVISHYANAEPQTVMEEGMITSIEPGIYRPGQWGVRIENLVLNVNAEETLFGDFLKFETLTLCPIDTRCVELALLRDDERTWLNDYHASVRARIGPHVSGDAKAWLIARTQAV